MATVTADALTKAGYKIDNEGKFFDTLTIDCSAAGKTSAEVQAAAVAAVPASLVLSGIGTTFERLVAVRLP